MRKLPLVLAGLFVSYNCFAELGQISVKSYLEQPLYATIPIYNVSGGNYSNLSINLATIDKFKSYGVAYNTDLGSLQFKVINQGSAHYLQITSSRSISSPVLNLLLHYQEDNNDFYRQYTVLLNPIQYSQNGYSSTTTVNQNARSSPIAVGSYSNTTTKSSYKSTKTPTSKYSGKYAQNFSNQFVKDHMSQFNAKDMTFTMNAGDTLYVPARFLQLMYSRAGFPINQVIMAMGFANYHDLKDQNYIYESGTTINLPDPAKIAKIPVALADEYVWRSEKNVEDRLALLSELAKKFDSSIELSGGDPTLFNQNGGTNQSNTKVAASSAIKANASGANGTPALNQSPSVQPGPYEEPSLVDQLLDFKLEIAGGLVVLAGLGLLLRRRKSKGGDVNFNSKKDKKEKSKIDDSLSQLHVENLQQKSVKKIADQVQEIKKASPTPKKVVEEKSIPLENAISVDNTLSSNKISSDDSLEFITKHEKSSRVESLSYEFNKPASVEQNIFVPSQNQVISDSTFGIKNADVEEPIDEVIDFAAPSDTNIAHDVIDTNIVSETIEEPLNEKQDVINDDVIDTLEQILGFDKGRNDIRLKLFELYLSHGATTRANQYYQELDDMLEFDDPLRTNLQHVASKLGFVPGSVSKLNFVDDKVISSQDIAVDVEHQSIDDYTVNVDEITPDNLMEFAKTGTVEEPELSNNYEHNSFIEPNLSLNIESEINTSNIVHSEKQIEDVPLSINPVHGHFEHKEGFTPEKLDRDVVDTLEQILSFDESRNDIRLKLFEMYSAADMYENASKYFIELDEILDHDDPHRVTLNELVYKFGFVEGDTEVLPKHFVDEVNLEVPQKILASDDHSLEFNSTNHSLLNNLDSREILEDVNFSSEHVIDFKPTLGETTQAPQIESEPTSSMNDERNIQQQISIASMYYQINENAKALELLKSVINSSLATFEQKDAAMKLILEHNLHV